MLPWSLRSQDPRVTVSKITILGQVLVVLGDYQPAILLDIKLCHGLHRHLGFAELPCGANRVDVTEGRP